MCGENVVGCDGVFWRCGEAVEGIDPKTVSGGLYWNQDGVACSNERRTIVGEGS